MQSCVAFSLVRAYFWHQTLIQSIRILLLLAFDDVRCYWGLLWSPRLVKQGIGNGGMRAKT